MQKIVNIALIILILTGCASTGKNTIQPLNRPVSNARDAVDKASDNNLTNNNFFITKGKISTSGEAGRISLFFTMKYKLPGIYLISLRTKSGIEAYRIFISKDTILVNDRLNKAVLTGKTVDFQRITGIPSELLKISIGDYFFSNPKYEENEACTNNEIKISDFYQGLVLKTTIDCSIGKSKTILLTTGYSDQYINVNYKKFRTDNNKMPKIVEVNDFSRRIEIKIAINRYTTPWYGDIEFIPGNGYSIRPIL